MGDAPPPVYVEAAVDAANRSTCEKSKRGAALWLPWGPTGSDLALGKLISTGHNAPVGFSCDGSAHCRATCGRRCEHAEAAAIRWSRSTAWPRDLDLLHVKTVDGVLVPSGEPSCPECSKAMMADGRIGGMWLFHEDGWRRYGIAEFHRLTLENCGLTE